MEIIKAYSFLGQSTGILGHQNINNRSRDEGNDEGVVVNSSNWPREEVVLMDDLSKPTNAKILNSEYKKSIGMNNYGNLNHVEKKRSMREKKKEIMRWKVGQLGEKGSKRERELERIKS